MVAPAEAPFVYGFAACLAIGSIVLLFLPLFRHLRDIAADRSVLGVAVVGLLGVSIAAVFAIASASADSAWFLPVVVVAVTLRLASPALLYHGIRDRLEVRRTWPAIRVTLAIAFAGFASFLVYGLFNALTGQSTPLPVALSEQFAMAVGASFLIVRTAYRFRPRVMTEVWPFLLSATAFAVAFMVIAPYAFPAFALVYWISGIIGWIAGLVVLRFFE